MAEEYHHVILKKNILTTNIQPPPCHAAASFAALRRCHAALSSSVAYAQLTSE